MDVPRKEMGMFISTNDLPSSPPYGFWVDRSGNFAVVPNLDHAKVGAELIMSAFNYKDKRKELEGEIGDQILKDIRSIKTTPFSKDTGIYGLLKRHSFLHLVKAGGLYHYYPTTVTLGQRKFLSALRDKYGMEFQAANEIF